MRRSATLFVVVTACLVLTQAAGASSYFVSSTGNDGNDGKSFANAWASISPANKTAFHSNDSLSFEAGKSFAGTLSLDNQDAGSATSRVVVGSFGTGKATINGGNGSALSVNGSSYLTIQNLIFVGSGRKTGNTADGVSVGSANHIIVDHVDVSGFQHSGINARGGTDVRITNSFVHENGYCGIYMPSGNNSYIGYCKVENNPGDPTVTDNWSGSGILVTGKKILVEYCEASNNGYDMPWHGNGPVGIWSYNGDSITFQYCIAHDNKTTGSDGDGFDFDGGCKNCVIQYCLSYHNQGAGMLLDQASWASGPWQNNTIRYNIFQNNGSSFSQSEICTWMDGGTYSNVYIYNNVFYSAVGYGIKNAVNTIPGAQLYNNIFVTKWAQIDNATNMTLKGNCYLKIGGGFQVGSSTDFASWLSSSGQEKQNGVVVGINADPMLTSPALIVSLTDPVQMKTFLPFMLKPGSPCIDKGLNLKSTFGIDPGSHDFYGNPIPYSAGFDIGAHEFLAANHVETGMVAPVRTRHVQSTLFRIADGKNAILQDRCGEPRTMIGYSLSGARVQNGVAMSGIVEKYLTEKTGP